ncbi:glycosyltransferase [Actinomadura flavalba]|uniref:glycosyltransferase n=1 Tax=Actinomadura flavalba TaxID=1120938 RepID=UPI0009DBA055|nr:glycosyltransferase [Actinomadura flavalba]
MRVLHVAQPVDGGVARYVRAVVRDQRARGWEVAVACPREGALGGWLRRDGVTHLPWEAGRAPSPGTVREAWALRRVVRGFAPDLVHLHSAKAGLAGRLVRQPAPVLFQPHGWSWLAATSAQAAASRAWERWAARRAARVVCVGTGEFEQGRDCRVEARYAVVRNGVDLRRFEAADAGERAAARAALGLPAAPLAVCVGRVTRQKGQDVLLDAWPLVRRRRPDAVLAVVGGGAERLPPQPGVVTVSEVDDTRPWLAAADVVVLPSRWEGLPLTALEALATGRSLVASDVPGLTEVVTPPVGALVPPDDAPALAAAVAARLDDPALADAEGTAARTIAHEYDEDATLAALAALSTDVSGVPTPGTTTDQDTATSPAPN